LGLIFLPWTTLAYLFVAPGGIIGFKWILIILGLMADIASYSTSAYGNRKHLSMSGSSKE